MRSRVPTMLICTATVVASLSMGEVARADRGKIPVLLQATFNTLGDVSAPKLRSERRETIAFSSDGDVMGPSPGHRELYIWDTEARVMSQVTNSGSGESYDPARATDDTATARVEYVAFVSTGDLDPGVGNADGNAEIFLWELLSGQINQLTNTLAPVENKTPYASDAGRCIVFASNGDLDDNSGGDPAHSATGWSNTDGSQEVFLVKLDRDNHVQVGSVTQVSNGPAGTLSWNPIIGDYYFPRQCQQTLYLSDHDQLADGATGVNIYRFRRNSGLVDQFSLSVRENPAGLPIGAPGAPVVYGNVAMSSAAVFATGPYVVYDTAADVLNSNNSTVNIYKYRIQHPRSSQYSIAELPYYARRPATSDGGDRIAFESNDELMDPTRKARGGESPPFNDDHNQEIFRTRGRRRLRQITDSPAGCENGMSSIQDTGRSIAFRSTCDLIPGNNPNGVAQVFLYKQITKRDPLAAPGACLVSEGCCSEANGCYRSIDGRGKPLPRKNCLNRRRGC